MELLDGLDLDTLVVVRKLESQPASLMPLEQVREDIVASIKRRKAEERVASLGPELVEQLESGTGWGTVLAEHEFTAEQVTWSRAEPPTEQPSPDTAVVEAVFRAPLPQEEQPVYGGVNLDNGDYVLFRLVEVIPGNADQAPEDIANQVHNSITRRQSQDMVEQYIADLRRQADISIREEQL